MTVPQLESDRQDPRHLVERMTSGDSAAWDTFVERYGPRILGTIRLGPQETDEVYSSVLARLVDRDYALLRGFRWKCSLETYLGWIARSEVRRFLQKRWKTSRALEREPALRSKPDDLKEELSKLEARDRLLLTLIFYDAVSYAEAAEVLGVSPNSVGPLVGRALLRLKQVLRGGLP